MSSEHLGQKPAFAKRHFLDPKILYLHCLRLQILQATVQKYAVSALRLSAWLEETLAEGFAVFDYPPDHRRSICTTNSLERINKEIRRRTRVVGVFPNEASCLRLISALLMEISEEWQNGKHYCAGKSSDC